MGAHHGNLRLARRESGGQQQQGPDRHDEHANSRDDTRPAGRLAPRSPARAPERPLSWPIVFVAALSLALATPLPPAPGSAAALEAERLLNAGLIGPALDLARARVAEAPGDVAAHEIIIDILTSTGRGRLARDAYAGLLQNAGAAPDFAYLLGRAEPSPEAAMAAYERALALAPGHARAWMGVGAVHLGRGAFPAALTAYRKALRLDPTLGEAWTGLISAQMRLGDRAAALASAREGARLLPTDVDIWLIVAELDPPTARGTLQLAVAAQPSEPRLQSALARACFEARDWAGARAAYDGALALAPPDAAALRVERALLDELVAGTLSYDAAARLLQVRVLSATDAKAARTLADAVVTDAPESAWARLVRGNLRAAAGDDAGAEADLRGALERLPASADAQTAYGLFLLDRRRAAEARPLLATAARARPEDPQLTVAAATAQAAAGDRAGALAALTAAIPRFPQANAPVLALARLHLDQAEVDAAFAVLSAALRRAPDPQIAAALAAAARESGRAGEAVTILRGLARETGDPSLARMAEALARAAAAAPR